MLIQSFSFQLGASLSRYALSDPKWVLQIKIRAAQFEAVEYLEIVVGDFASPHQLLNTI